MKEKSPENFRGIEELTKKFGSVKPDTAQPANSRTSKFGRYMMKIKPSARSLGTNFQTEKTSQLRSVYAQQLEAIVEKARTSIKDFSDEGSTVFEERIAIKSPFGAQKSLKPLEDGDGCLKSKSRRRPRTSCGPIGDSGGRRPSIRPGSHKYARETVKLPDIRQPKTISAIRGRNSNIREITP